MPSIAKLPLEGLRVLAVEQYGAGPWGTMQLADLGAEIIKIEDPASAGDVGRYVPPFQDGENSLFFESFNRNKLSISLDLKTDVGQRAFHDLVAASDAVYCNLRGDQPERLGLTYEQLKHRNPRIVCCSLSGFGRTGPRRAQGAYDYILQGMAGWMNITGEPDGPPTKSGLPLVDLSGGYVAALALMGGLWQAMRDGHGCNCDVSLFDTALSELVYVATWNLSAGYRPPRVAESSHLSLVPFQTFAASDGWVIVCCPKEKFWRRFAAAIDRPELADDPRFVNFAARHAHRDELLAILRSAMAERTASEWISILTDAGVPNAPVYEIADVFDDPQAKARQSVVETDHPVLGRVAHVRSPLRVGSAPAPVTRAPFRGEHTQAVFQRVCGYGEQEFQGLAAQGAFGAPPTAAAR